MSRIRPLSRAAGRFIPTRMRRVVAGLPVASAVMAVACGPVRSIELPSAPGNACPAHPCANYLQTNDVACAGGLCIIQPATAPATHDLVVLVSMPQDAFYAADQTFVVTQDALERSASGSTSMAGTRTGAQLTAADAAPGSLDSGSSSSSRRSFVLPQTLQMVGDYEVTPQVAQSVNRNLDETPGNNAALPFHATFRLLWPQAENGLVEATQLGLPVAPIQASVTLSYLAQFGPGRGPWTQFTVNLQPQTYVRELVADPPFDEAFGPVIQAIDRSSPCCNTIACVCFEPTVVGGYDIAGGTTVPSLSISRAGGSLDGWTAYLRDVTTQRPVSNVAPLSGARASVTFAVKRSLSLDPAQPDLDALQDDVLVVAPPEGSIEPTGAFNLFNTLADVEYPALPPFVRVTGSVSALDGTPVAASVTFEKESIAVLTSGSSGPNSPTTMNTTNLELTRTVSTGRDPAGTSRYETTLPEGVYRIDVRPADTERSIQIQSSISIATNSTVDFALPPPSRVHGIARVADGRPLAGATVEAIPAQCAGSSAAVWCLPRFQQTVTGTDGAFAFDTCHPKTPTCVDAALDPGAYALRVRPAAGTRLPWVIVAQPLVVTGGSTVSVPPIIVPAPLGIGTTLLDPAGNPAPNALVRVFRMGSRSAGPAAVEVGEALTEADGSYEMYVAPATP